ncbi:hypothetical protein [Kiloniella sp. EL199]|uniref:hypothetical protein n=1 Tax=Kiloniella sp. EL199 TaxID=2107581 RepID=UPI0013C5128A|nr:hypothetical protein [Kiloniella sp. EL199]
MPTLIAAIESEYFKPADYSLWVAKLILTSDDFENWMYEIALPSTPQNLISTLHTENASSQKNLQYESPNHYFKSRLQTIEHDELLAGFYLLRYEREEISLPQLLDFFTDVSDGSYSLKIDIEEVGLYTKSSSIQQFNELDFLKHYAEYINWLRDTAKTEFTKLISYKQTRTATE